LDAPHPEDMLMTAYKDDIQALTTTGPVSRRSVMAGAGGLTAGFAIAVQPVSAQTITTSAEGLEAGEVKLPTSSGEIPAYRAMPQGAGPFPVILVVQEIFGVHEHIKDVCRRFAKLGHMAIAPELYFRQGDVSKMGDMQAIVRDVVFKVPDAQVMSDLDAAVAYAKASGKGDVSKLAITGFCWGGRITWLYAAHNPDVKAGIAWYGRLVGDKSANTPAHPVDLAAQLKAPVLGLYGAADTGIPVATVEQMKAACQAAGKTCEFQVYPDTPHAFHADYRPSYRAEQARDGWARANAWLKQHGAA
jgi:carboxymethylenebutenolidase